MSDGFVSRYVESTIPKDETFETRLDSGEKVDIDTPISDKDKPTIEPPLSKYREVKGMPYTAEYFDIEYWDALSPEMDPDGMIKTVAKIEDFVAKEIKTRGFEDTVSSYNDIMDHITSFLKINSNEKLENKVDKIKAYIGLKTKMANAEKKRQKIMKELEALHG